MFKRYAITKRKLFQFGVTTCVSLRIFAPNSKKRASHCSPAAPPLKKHERTSTRSPNGLRLSVPPAELLSERDASVAPFSGNVASNVKSAVPLDVHTSGASTHEVDLPLSCSRSHTLTRSHRQLGSCSRSPLTERTCPRSPVLARHRQESLRDPERTAGFLLGPYTQWISWLS